MGHNGKVGGGVVGDGGVEDEDGLIDEEAQDEVENGSREVKKMHEPRLPSKEEREMHAMTHVPLCCCLYTSDAADDLPSVDLGARCISEQSTYYTN